MATSKQTASTGYVTKEWSGMPLYECKTCGFNVVGKDNLPRMEEHMQENHPKKGEVALLTDSPAGLPADVTEGAQVAHKAPADKEK